MILTSSEWCSTPNFEDLNLIIHQLGKKAGMNNCYCKIKIVVWKAIVLGSSQLSFLLQLGGHNYYNFVAPATK